MSYSIAEVFEKEPATENLLASEKFATLLKEKQCAWRRVMSLTVMAGVTAPTGMAALSYYDAMCTKRLPERWCSVCATVCWRRALREWTRRRESCSAASWNK